VVLCQHLMMEQLSPSTVAPAAASYSLGVVLRNPEVLLHTAGIVGTSPDGRVPDDLHGQATNVWRTIAALVEEAGLLMSDLLSYTTYAVDGEDLAVVMAARDEALNGHKCASTLIVVPRLARPEWRVEVAVVAGR
jgi:2-iminobutanoate/2-iminopropanoate deaminase